MIVTDVLDRVLVTPPDLAVYDTDLATAEKHLRVDPRQLVALADRGFPHRAGAHGEPLFDYTDLTNVALAQGDERTIPELARRFLLRFAESPPETWFEPRDWIVSVRKPSLDRGGEAAADLAVALPDGETPGVEIISLDIPSVRQPISTYTATVRLCGKRDSVSSPEAKDIYDRVLTSLTSEDVRYQNVSQSLRAHHQRAWSCGMADCVVASRLLKDRLCAAGFRARVRKGFLLGLLGSDHAWCEIHENGRWKTLDPVFAYLAGQVGAADFASACRGSRFNRLLPCLVADGQPILTMADGSPAPLWYFAAVGARPWRQ